MKTSLKEQVKNFSAMKENYLLANEHLPFGFKSTHWDSFDRKFHRLFSQYHVWENMLRNQLTLGLNDNLIEISNRRFSDKGDDFWRKLREGEIKDIIFEKRDSKNIKMEIKFIKAVIALTDLNFVVKNCLTDVGNPVITKIKIDYKSESHIINYNYHDTYDLYHAWLILKHLDQYKNCNPIICEIGGGYGGLAAKIKSNVKGAKIIMFDLPEVNAYQTFYLSRVFEGANIKGYKDFIKQGIRILKENFDFLILPGWAINQLPQASVNSYINVRSMMEMNKENLEFYFKVIQSSLKIGGNFSCFNRYTKLVGNFENRLDLYPFDDDWEILMSQASVFQPHIHQFILQRKENNSGFNFRQKLKDVEKK